MANDSLCFLEQTDFSLLLARGTAGSSPLRLEALQEVPLADVVALGAAIRGVFGSESATAVCALRPKARQLHLATGDEAKRFPGLAGVRQLATTLPIFSSLAPDWIAAVSARDGAAPGATPWLASLASVEGFAASTTLLASLSLKSSRNVSAILNAAGAMTTAVTAPVWLLDVGELASYALLISREGILAAGPVSLTLDRIAEAVQAELGLKFRGSAIKLFFNPAYDYTEVGPRIAARLAAPIKADLTSLRGGNDAPIALACIGLPATQQWFSAQLAAALELAAFAPEVKSAGVTFATPELEATVSPAWFGFLRLAGAHRSGAPSAWDGEWLKLDTIPLPTATKSAAPAAAPTPTPVIAVAPAPAPKAAAAATPAAPVAAPVAARQVTPDGISITPFGQKPPAPKPAVPAPFPLPENKPTAAARPVTPAAASPETPTARPAASAPSATPAARPVTPTPATPTPAAATPAARVATPAQPATPAARPATPAARPAAPAQAATPAPRPATPPSPVPVAPVRAPAAPATQAAATSAKPVAPASPKAASASAPAAKPAVAGSSVNYSAKPSAPEKAAAAKKPVPPPVPIPVNTLPMAELPPSRPFLKSPAALILLVLIVVVGVGGYFFVKTQSAESEQLKAEKARTEQRLQDEIAKARVNEEKAQAETAARKKVEAEAAQKLADAEAARQRAENDARVQSAARLANARGILVIATDPVGAMITVGNLPPRPSPATYTDLKIGKYPVSIALNLYDTAQLELEVKDDQTTDSGVIKLNKILGSLELVTDPADLAYEVKPANALLVLPDARRSGRTPGNITDLIPGDYTVTFTRDGWMPQTENVTIVRDSTAHVKASFPNATVKISSKPAGGIVTRDGVRLGVTPLVLNDQSPGDVSYVITLIGYAPEPVMGHIVGGQTLELNPQLEVYDHLSKLSELDQQPKVIATVQPKIPYEFRLSRKTAQVKIELTVTRDGSTRDFVVLPGSDHVLSNACLEAAAQWKFRPGSIHGRAANVRVIVPFSISAPE